jgi:hypothetical protein
MKRIITLAFLYITVMTMNAQTLTGIVVDENNKPMEFVNIAVLNVKDSAFVNGVTSGLDGNFCINIKDKQMLRFSIVGYKTKYIIEPNTALGTIHMLPVTLKLNEVVVKGNLPKTRIKGDALITNIEGSVLEHSGTSIDLLNKIPMVEAEGENVSVFGRGDAVVYINGREVKDKKELTRLNSDMIKRVEVIQNPGAQYAASVKAVIRIFMKKNQGEGFSLDNETRYSYQYDNEWYEKLYMNYRKRGFDFGVTLWGQRQIYGEDKTITQTTYLKNKWYQNADTRIRNYTNIMFAPTLTLNWQLNDDHSIGLRYSYFRLPKQYMENSYVNTEVFRDETPLENSMSYLRPVFRSWNHSFNLYYSGKTKDWQIDINSDIYLAGELMKSRTDETVTDHTSNQETVMAVDAINRTRNNLFAVKAKASHPLWGGQLTFGTEDSYTHRTSNYSNPQHIVKDDESVINETLLSAFMEYSHNIGKMSINTGLRFEHTDNNYYVFGKRMDEQCKKYNDLFPSVALSMPIGKVQASVSYSRDINRPAYSMLRSSVYYDNKYTLEGGNPLLTPEYDDNIVLNAAWKWINFTAGYSHIKHQPTMLSEPYSNEHPEVSYLHPIEQKPYNSWHTGINISPAIKCWTPNLYIYLRGQDFKADTKDGERTLNHPIASLGLMNHIALSHDWYLDANYTFQSKGHASNVKLLRNQQSFNFTVMKQWMKGKLETRLQLQDAFNQNGQCVRLYNGMREVEELKNSQRTITLSIRYKFNAARNNYKGQGAGSSQKNRM